MKVQLVIVVFLDFELVLQPVEDKVLVVIKLFLLSKQFVFVLRFFESSMQLF